MSALFPVAMPFPCFLLLLFPYPTPPLGWVSKSLLCTPSISREDSTRAHHSLMNSASTPPHTKTKTHMLLPTRSSCLEDKAQLREPFSTMNEKLLEVGATSHSTTDAQIWGRSDLTENTMVQLLPPQLSASAYLRQSHPGLLPPEPPCSALLTTGHKMLVYRSVAWRDP